ncbi:hypothetical protein [Desulfosporosinus nitroreducens]|uniref:hypothetical protein n=1 Tax=Desulfosporosinus nitroreducens TaxID=2018668 RepID=UPI00207CDB91|nr:hypothetical protein [Desulfosporosinus nitroreducens]MCO1599849.1 hypothetical protein [Desulfosporosinus nitroreducens]
MKIDKERATNLWEGGLLDTEIAEIMNCTKAAVCIWRKKNDLPHNRWLVNGKSEGNKKC